MIKEGLEYLVRLAHDAKKPELLLETDLEKVFLVAGVDHYISKPRPLPVSLMLHDMVDFVQWVKLQAKRGDVEYVTVMVDDKIAMATVDMETRRRYQSWCPLLETPEWHALEQIRTKRLTQQSLWKYLVGDLRDCFPVDLRMALGQVKVSASREAEVAILDSGLSTDKGGKTIRVEFATKGDPRSTQSADLPVIWEYTGPVYKGICEHTYSLDLRLFMDVAEGLTFMLQPLGFGRFMTGVMDDLLSDLRSELKHDKIQVFYASEAKTNGQHSWG